MDRFRDALRSGDSSLLPSIPARCHDHRRALPAGLDRPGERMRTFRYDPGRTFRGWLRRLCQSRAIDLLRKMKANAMQSLEGHPAASHLQDAFEGIESRKARRRNARFCSDWPRSPGRRSATGRRTDVAGLLDSRRRGAVRPRGFRSRGHLLLRRVRRPEACRPDAPRGGATAHGRAEG